jgi:hypothetical protein
MNANLILGLIFILLALLIWRFSKPKAAANAAVSPTQIKALEIEGVPCAVKKMDNTSGTICRILVRNKSIDTSANNVNVELISMEDSTENKPALRQVLPLLLKQEPHNETTINPGANLPFTLFDAVLQHPKVTANFQRPGSRDKRWMLFEVERDYPVKIKVTSDCSFTETEFNLKFSEIFSACKFTLTKINP